MPVPPVSGEALTFFVALTSQADTDIFQVNPTLAIGDVTVSTDGGALNNITVLPVVTPAGGAQVQVDLSIAEMTGDVIGVLFSDVVGAEWQDLYIEILTDTQHIGDIPTAAQVMGADLDEVVNSAAHFGADTVGEALTIIRALVQQNFVVDNTVYNANRLLTGCRVRIFDSAVLALAATDGAAPGADGEFASFTASAVEEPAIDGVASIYRMTRTT